MSIELLEPGKFDDLEDLSTAADDRLVIIALGFCVDPAKAVGEKDPKFANPELMSPETKLVRDIFFPGDASRESLLTTFRANAFTVNLARNLIGTSQLKYDFGDIRESATPQDFRRASLDQAQQYLNRRTSLGNIIDLYLEDISPEPNYCKTAKLLAGYLLMCIDRAQQNNYIDEKVSDYRQQLDGWNGRLPDSI